MVDRWWEREPWTTVLCEFSWNPAACRTTLGSLLGVLVLAREDVARLDEVYVDELKKRSKVLTVVSVVVAVGERGHEDIVSLVTLEESVN